MRNVSLSFAFAAALVATVAFGACKEHEHGDDHPHPDGGVHQSPYPTCDRIIKACHPLDVGVGKISECHVFAHEAQSDDECIAKRDECLSACVAAPDAGAADAEAEASSDASTD